MQLTREPWSVEIPSSNGDSDTESSRPSTNDVGWEQRAVEGVQVCEPGKSRRRSVLGEGPRRESCKDRHHEEHARKHDCQCDYEYVL